MSEFGETLEEMDVEAFFNMRDWLSNALLKAGGKQVGAGIGMGQADVDIVLDGMEYCVSIRPLSNKKGRAVKLANQEDSE